MPRRLRTYDSWTGTMGGLETYFSCRLVFHRADVRISKLQCHRGNIR
jgi:hypothetical protein